MKKDKAEMPATIDVFLALPEDDREVHYRENGSRIKNREFVACLTAETLLIKIPVHKRTLLKTKYAYRLCKDRSIIFHSVLVPCCLFHASRFFFI